jgi:hypothetical protein
MAVKLVRQCWGNHPLTLKERKLDSISELSNLNAATEYAQRKQ